MVPIAMAIPDRLMTLESTPNARIAMNVIRTARGRTPLTSNALRRWSSRIRMTTTVTRISWVSASSNVPRVSWISPVRS